MVKISGRLIARSQLRAVTGTSLDSSSNQVLGLLSLERSLVDEDSRGFDEGGCRAMEILDIKMQKN